MVIYARNDDDVTPEEIMRQVTKSTSNFTYVAPKETEDIPTAVVRFIFSYCRCIW